MGQISEKDLQLLKLDGAFGNDFAPKNNFL